MSYEELKLICLHLKVQSRQLVTQICLPVHARLFVVISKPVLHPHVPSVVVTLLHAPFVIVSQCALSSLLHVDPIITKLKRRININVTV